MPSTHSIDLVPTPTLTLMRIIAGHARGLRLAAPPRGSSWIRPTTDRVKESLFNLLQARVSFVDCAVLDLFSGTGALGCEALSRGATRAVFVDKDARSIRIIRENLHKMRAPQHTVLQKSASAALRTLKQRNSTPFDLVFLDPPYPLQLLASTLQTLHSSSLLTPHAILAAEHPPTEPNLDSVPFQLLTQRSYGSTCLSLWSNTPNDADTTTTPDTPR